MKALPDDRQIYISSRLWHEIYPKVNLLPFIVVLHDGIDLQKYGDGLQKFYFTFIIVIPEDKINTPYIHVSRKKKEVDLAIDIPYDQAENATKVELIKLMEAAYLRGIEKLRKITFKGAFDVDAFKQDVQAIFAQDNWFEVAIESN